jgi:hypothetical protein
MTAIVTPAQALRHVGCRSNAGEQRVADMHPVRVAGKRDRHVQTTDAGALTASASAVRKTVTPARSAASRLTLRNTGKPCRSCTSIAVPSSPRVRKFMNTRRRGA